VSSREPLADPRISDSAVRRLSGYFRILGELEESGEVTVSSYGLAERAGVTPAQVRKDLSFFGQFGKRGTGYDICQLHARVQSILGLDRRWRICLVGAGNLAHALSAYKEFAREGFDIEAVLDNDPAKIGQRWGNLTIESVEGLARVVAERKLDIGVITTPASAAQEVADRFVKAGVSGILNFAPRELFVPESINLRNVNLAIELECLSFALK
jgi:redox-sensing transcriptional repressor